MTITLEKSSNTMTYNQWIEHIRNERRKIAEKLERLGDKPVMSQQERIVIADGSVQACQMIVL